MHYSKQKFESFITNSRAILNISSKANNIREAIGEYGYNQDRLADGNRLYEDLVEIAQLQEKKEREKKECFDKKAVVQSAVAADYMKYLKIARIVFNKDEEAFVVLSLKGARERIYNKWYHQVTVFCNNLLANEEYIKKMNSFGVGRKSIEKLKEDLEDLQSITEECTRLTAKVRKIVREKRERTIKWQEWLSDYIKILRIALQGTSVADKEWLKQLLSKGQV